MQRVSMNYLNDNINHGVIITPRETTDWVDGGLVGSDLPEINPTGQWPVVEKELQNRGVETMACVSFSALNCLEILNKFYGVDVNYSDRWLATKSFTEHDGNSFVNVADSIKKDGLVMESEWPFPEVPYSWEIFYTWPPSEMLQKAKFLSGYTYRWVNTTVDDMKQALKKGPLQVCNKYHAFCVVGYDDEGWKTFDTYGDCNGHVPYSYKFEAALLHNMAILPVATNDERPNISDNTIVQLTEPGYENSGEYGLKLGDYILVSDGTKDRVLATFLIRQFGRGLTKKAWDSFTKKTI